MRPAGRAPTVPEPARTGAPAEDRRGRPVAGRTTADRPEEVARKTAGPAGAAGPERRVDPAARAEGRTPQGPRAVPAYRPGAEGRTTPGLGAVPAYQPEAEGRTTPGPGAAVARRPQGVAPRPAKQASRRVAAVRTQRDPEVGAEASHPPPAEGAAQGQRRLLHRRKERPKGRHGEPAPPAKPRPRPDHRRASRHRPAPWGVHSPCRTSILRRSRCRTLHTSSIRLSLERHRRRA